MAKLLAPLMSFEARGALSKSLVYFPWKGINAVRSYVVPANPKTDAQKTQRDIMKAAVAEWHAALYTTGDVTAWNRFAGIIGSIMTGFNAMVKTYVTEKLLDNVWTRIWNGSSNTPTATNFVVVCHKAAGGEAPVCWYGTSKTALLTSVILASGGGDTWQNLTGTLTADTLYYFTFKVGTSASDYGRLGIYTQRTLAA